MQVFINILGSIALIMMTMASTIIVGMFLKFVIFSTKEKKEKKKDEEEKKREEKTINKFNCAMIIAGVDKEQREKIIKYYTTKIM